LGKKNKKKDKTKRNGGIGETRSKSWAKKMEESDRENKGCNRRVLEKRSAERRDREGRLASKKSVKQQAMGL